MSKFKIAICEDEETQRIFYREICRSLSEKHKIETEIKLYSNGDDLLFDLENPKFYTTLDLLFLDIRMPGISGIETAKLARKAGFGGLIIFITASKAYYESAFDVGAFHYLTKGEHGPERFEEVFLKAVRISEEGKHDIITLSGGGGDMRQIEIRDIEYVEINMGTLTVHYNGEEFDCVTTLEKLEETLFDRGFRRIHRGFIVSLKHIKTISYTETVLHSGTTLPVGRKYYPDLKDAVKGMKNTVGSV